MPFHTIAARCNCPSDWGRDTRCPKCNQFHLRPGYCQALNPEASAAIAAGGVETLDEARRLAALPEELTLPPPGPFSFETEEEKLRRLAHARTVLEGVTKRVRAKPVPPVTDKPVDRPVDTQPVHTAPVDSSVDKPVDRAAERKAYKREWMRKQREAKSRQAD